jgi:hypothetical protein
MYDLMKGERCADECPFCKEKIDVIYWAKERADWINDNRGNYHTYPINNHIKGRRHTYPYPWPQCECGNQIQLAYFNTKNSDGNYLCIMPRREQDKS